MTNHPPRILVVDDDPTILELVAFCFDDEGYAVRTAIDGDEALRQVADWTPDLIVLDVQMPRLDGRCRAAARPGRT